MDTDALVSAGNDLKQIITQTQSILERHLKPDGISADDAMSEIAELVDGPQWRAAKAAWNKARGE
jgi:phage terminase large subunit-like protein